MWTEYLTFSADHPFFAASVQFAILGTLGEILARRLRGARSVPGAAWFFLKTAGWGLLGIYIKLMFVTAAAGSDAFGGAQLSTDILRAFLRSALMNVMLGPSMMILHRLSDNGIDRATGLRPAGWDGLGNSMATLLWLWIPLHTVTFLQPPELRAGLAALLSLVLGIVMGAFGGARKRHVA